MALMAWLYFYSSLLLLGVASYTDLKTRTISNKLTYSGITLGLLLHAFQGYQEQDAGIFIISAGVTIVTFAAAYGLWKMGVWAGGDVKLMTALAALNPVNYGVIRDALGIMNFSLWGIPMDVSSFPVPVFPLTLFVFSIFSILPYGFLITLNAVYHNPDLRKKTIEGIREIVGKSVGISAAVAGLTVLGDAAGFPSFYALLGVVGVFYFVRWKYALVLLILAGAVYVDAMKTTALTLSVLAPLLVLYVMIRFYWISKDDVLKQKLRVEELEEGMVPAISIVKEGDRYHERDTLILPKIIKYVRTNDLAGLQQALHPQGEVLVDANRAAGISEEQAIQLKKLAREGKIGDEILIKKTAPLVPAILLGYLITQVAGDWLWHLIFLG